MHNILRRHDDELIKREYFEMKDVPLISDWNNIVKEDMDTVSLNLCYDGISMLPSHGKETHEEACV